MDTSLTSGLPGFDRLIKGILPGDNLVWRVDEIEDYGAIAQPYAAAAAASGLPLIYFRFASHPPLLPADSGATVHTLDPRDGFEPFVSAIHTVIDRAGTGAFYLFDCLSELATEWYSDAMLGNFFVLTCPYLFDMEAIAYFALLRKYDVPESTATIASTAQVLVDVYRHCGDCYVRPLKVQHRYSPMMNMLHAWKDGTFKPVTSSALTSAILMRGQVLHREGARLPEAGEGEGRTAAALDLPRAIRTTISRDEAMFTLFENHLTAEDIRAVQRRLIGTGLIGGKAAGMLLARAIVRRRDRRLASLLEPHDSFYVGSDVFYTYLVRNGIWRLRRRQRDPDRFLEVADEGRQRILTGSFPDSVLKQLETMLDYFGEAPFIVRSSSLLEDAYGNSFAGKYESIFCVNQGPRERRLENLLAAIRSIYASTMSEKALRYRASRGLLDRDEQMSLLIMRVSGFLYGTKFYPHVAGVGFSFNPFAWHPDIDPRAGVIRLVFGLGTRAVDRSDDDYTRVVALNAPQRRPESSDDEVRQYAQRRMDYLDLDANQLSSAYFMDVVRNTPELPVDMFAAEHGALADGTPNRVLTFDRLLSETDFVADCRRILRLLEETYRNPVDVEFAANFEDGRRYTINLLQCRPLQVQGLESGELPELSVPPSDLILGSHGAVIGHSRLERLDRLVYVVPERYAALPPRDRYEVARLLGRINRTGSPKTLLMGPGRWGTRSPSLGIPVVFAEINRATAVCELVMMHEHLTPDASLGTHFLNELVEMNMLYLAIYPGREGSVINRERLLQAPNHLAEATADSAAWHETIRVVHAADLAPAGSVVALCADARRQTIQCFVASESALAVSFAVPGADDAQPPGR